MEERLTRMGSTRHTKTMPDEQVDIDVAQIRAEVEATSKEFSASFSAAVIAKIKEEDRKNKTDDASEQANTDKQEKPAESEIVEEAQESTSIEKDVVALAEALKDVKDEKTQRALIDTFLDIKAALNHKATFDQVLAPNLTEQFRQTVQQVHEIKDLSQLQQFVSKNGHLYQEYVTIQKNYAREFVREEERETFSKKVALEYVQIAAGVLRVSIENEGAVDKAKQKAVRVINDLNTIRVEIALHQKARKEQEAAALSAQRSEEQALADALESTDEKTEIIDSVEKNSESVAQQKEDFIVNPPARDREAEAQTVENWPVKEAKDGERSLNPEVKKIDIVTPPLLVDSENITKEDSRAQLVGNTESADQPKKIITLDDQKEKADEEEFRPKGKFMVSPLIVKYNAQLGDEERLEEADVLFRELFLEISHNPDELLFAAFSESEKAQMLSDLQEVFKNGLTDSQKAAILEAHTKGKNGIYRFSTEELKEKYKILQKEFTPTQIRILMEYGITGDNPPSGEEAEISIPEKQTQLLEASLREQQAIRRNTDTMVAQLGDLLGIAVEQRDELRKLNDEQMERLIQAINFSKLTLDEVKEELSRLGFDEPQEMRMIDRIMRDIESINSLDDFKRISERGGSLRKHRFGAVRDFAKANMGKFKGGTYIEGDEWSGTAEDYIRRQMDEFEYDVRYVIARAEEDGGLDIDVIKNESLNISQDTEAIQEEANIISGANSREVKRKSRAVENIEELMDFIMELHPDFGPESDHPLLTPERELDQGNFLEWIRSQLVHYHNQDADNPQVNFFGNINVEVENQGYARTVSVLHMINNPGVFFLNQHGRVLNGLRDEVERTVWQFATNRNNNIAYIQSMPLDTKIADVVSTLYSNNALTKPAYEGKTPFFWNLTQSESYSNETRQDARVGEGIVDGTMIYYDITDYKALKVRCAPIKDEKGEIIVSPLFRLDAIEDSVREALIGGKRPPEDKYFDEETWSMIRSWYDENGVLRDDKAKEFIEFFNPYTPQYNMRAVAVLRDLIRGEISRKTGISSKSAEYAELWAQFQINFMLISARNGVGAASFNAAEKGLRMLEYYERAWSDTKPGLGNPKALGLLVAPGVDFLRGTQVRASYFEEVEKKSITDEKGNYKTVVIENKSEGTRFQLGKDEEIVYVGGKRIEDHGDGTFEFIDRDSFDTFEIIGRTDEDNVERVKDEGSKFQFKKKDGSWTEWIDKANEDGTETASYELVGEGKYQIVRRKWSFARATGLEDPTTRIIVKTDNNGKRTIVHKLDSDSVISIAGDEKPLDRGDGVQIAEKVFIGGTFAYRLEIGESAEEHDGEIWIKQGDRVVKKVRSFMDKFKDGKKDVYGRRVEVISIDENGNETSKNGERIRSNGTQAKVVKQKVVTTQIEHKLTTYDVLHKMDEKRLEWSQRIIQESDKEKREELQAQADAEIASIALLLEYDADEQRQFSQNQFGRAMGLFHEYGEKFVIDPKKFYSYDEKKGFVFDQAALQEEIGEKLIKPRRYAFRTWPHLDMSRVVRAPNPEKRFAYDDMHLAEAIFGKSVIESFRRKDGTIDWEFLSTREGIKELIKTEVLLRIAADISYHEDLGMLTPRVGLQARYAFKKAIFTLPDKIDIDYSNTKNNKVGHDFFGKRKISFDEYGADYEKVYEMMAGKIKDSVVKELRNNIITYGARGLWDAFKTVVGGALKS